MRELIIAVPDHFGKTLEPEKVTTMIQGELVRCRDCQFYGVRCVLHNVYTNADNFCSWAVKRIYEHRSTKSGHGKGRI